MEETRDNNNKNILLEKIKPLAISFWINIALMCFTVFGVLFLPIFTNGNGVVQQTIELFKGESDAGNMIYSYIVSIILHLFLSWRVYRLIHTLIFYKIQKWGRVGGLSKQIASVAILFTILAIFGAISSVIGSLNSQRLVVISFEGLLIGIGLPMLGMITSVVCNFCTPLVRLPKEKITYYITYLICCFAMVIAFSNMSIGKIQIMSNYKPEIDLTFFSFNDKVDSSARFENGEFIFDLTNYDEFANNTAFGKNSNNQELGEVSQIIVGITFIITIYAWVVLVLGSFLFLMGALLYGIIKLRKLAIMKTNILSEMFFIAEFDKKYECSIEEFNKMNEDEMIIDQKNEKEKGEYNICNDGFKIMVFGVIGYVCLSLNMPLPCIVTINIAILLMLGISWIAIRLTWKKYYNKYILPYKPCEEKKN